MVTPTSTERPLHCPSCGAQPPPEDLPDARRWSWKGPKLQWPMDYSHSDCCGSKLYAMVGCNCGWSGPRVSAYNASKRNQWKNPEVAAEAIRKWNIRA